ncbi:uncharacterized protein PG986_001328 [Apiospora aurea]|uniref:Uncharacterized protein n=1 Tax=Apiospora aurea TaxID=335848 RepID=A0ABR1QXI8_9PEZI
MAMDSSIFEFFKEWYEAKPEDDADDEELRKFGGRYGPSRLDTMPKTMPSEWIIGNEFGVQIDNSGTEERTVEDWHCLYSDFGKYSPTPIHWLTKAPSKGELQLAYIAYGNESVLETEYSNCAILVTIPPKGAEVAVQVG